MQTRIENMNHLIQGSDEWIKWRRSKIGASDASIILNENPYRNILQLWEEKVYGICQDDNFFMIRGRELEPLALLKFEEMTGYVMFPKVIEHPSISYMIASFDGLTMDNKKGIEIKIPGKKTHKYALEGKIPPIYKAQLQHQFETCKQLEELFYFSFDGEEGIILEVKRDDAYIENLLKKEREFWKYVETLTPPIGVIL